VVAAELIPEWTCPLGEAELLELYKAPVRDVEAKSEDHKYAK
jgi:hypothetical protein